jgi:hypothetical protein
VAEKSRSFSEAGQKISAEPTASTASTESAPEPVFLPADNPGLRAEQSSPTATASRPDRVKLPRALAKKSNDENLRHRKERCHLGDRALHQDHTLPSSAEGSAAKRNPEPSGPHTVPKVLASVAPNAQPPS